MLQEKGVEEARAVFVAFIFLILYPCHHGLDPEIYSKLPATRTLLYSNFSTFCLGLGDQLLCKENRVLFQKLSFIFIYNYLHISLQSGIWNWPHMHTDLHVKDL